MSLPRATMRSALMTNAIPGLFVFVVTPQPVVAFCCRVLGSPIHVSDPTLASWQARPRAA